MRVEATTSGRARVFRSAIAVVDNLQSAGGARMTPIETYRTGEPILLAVLEVRHESH